MYPSSQTTKEPLSAFFFYMSVVVLGVAIIYCTVVVVEVVRASRKTGNNDDSGTGLVNNGILRCIYVLSLLIAIGLVVLSRLLSRPRKLSDQSRLQDALLALLISIPRVYIVYELQFLWLVWDSYRYAVWVGSAHCVAFLVVMFSFIGCGIDQTIISKTSLAVSSVEYFAIGFGYIDIYRRTFQRKRRMIVLLYTNLVVCFTIGIFALIPLVLKQFVKVDFVIFQWTHAIVTSLFQLRFLAFFYTREKPSSTYVPKETASQSELIDRGGGKSRVNPNSSIEDEIWLQNAAYQNSIYWGDSE